MKIKKNKKYDLENYRGLFLRIGLVISVFTIYYLVEIKSYEDIDYGSFGDLDMGILDEEEAIITEQQKPPPPPPPPPPAAPVEILKVVDDDIDIIEVDIASTDDTDGPIEILPFEDEEEQIEAVNFMVVENKPVFPGCENEPDEKAKYNCFQKMIHKHIVKTFKYPEIAMEMEVQGTVLVSFEISKTGEISKIKIVRGVDKSLDGEASRIVKLLPKVIPAQQRGKPVPVKYTLPVAFRLSY